MPEKVEDPTHVDGLPAEVIFTGAARAMNHSPAWNESQASCGGTYCHSPSPGEMRNSPAWNQEKPLDCASCHGLPPVLPHPQSDNCSSCHSARRGLRQPHHHRQEPARERRRQRRGERQLHELPRRNEPRAPRRPQRQLEHDRARRRRASNARARNRTLTRGSVQRMPPGSEAGAGCGTPRFGAAGGAHLLGRRDRARRDARVRERNLSVHELPWRSRLRTAIPRAARTPRRLGLESTAAKPHAAAAIRIRRRPRTRIPENPCHDCHANMAEDDLTFTHPELHVDGNVTYFNLE